MPTYTIRVNHRFSMSTQSATALAKELAALKRIGTAGPITVDEDDREMRAVEVEELLRDLEPETN